MKSTQPMRDRLRELTDANSSGDYDRAVVCVLDDLDLLSKVLEDLTGAAESLQSQLRRCSKMILSRDFELHEAEIERARAATSAVPSEDGRGGS